MFRISIRGRKIQTQDGFTFGRTNAMRFEFLTLLAFMRKTQAPDLGWVTLEAVGRLPLWQGRTKQHRGTNIGRYVQGFERGGMPIVETKSPWRGPYRLDVGPAEIEFDVPLFRVEERLGFPAAAPASIKRVELFSFTKIYSHAAALFYKGRLVARAGSKARLEKGAMSELTRLMADRTMDSRLRLLAYLAAVRVRDRLGHLKMAAGTLRECERLRAVAQDPVIEAKALLADAWGSLRAGKHDRALQTLARAKGSIAKTADCALSGVLAAREGLVLANMVGSAKPHPPSSIEKFSQALDYMAQGLYSSLLADHHDAVQSICFDIGNILQRMGEAHYMEASQWLRLSVTICSEMHLGRYDALAEILLAKIAVEQGRRRSFQKWILQAEKTTHKTRNRIDDAWCHTIRALYQQRYGRPNDIVEELVLARRVCMALPEYNRPLRDDYHNRKFPEVWSQVLARFSAGSAAPPGSGV